MLNKQIYILRGTTGEYSDRMDWLVRAYADEADAIRDQQDLTDAFAKLWKFMKDNEIPHYVYDAVLADDLKPTYDMLHNSIKEVDERFQMDYTGTSWWVSPVFFQE